MARSRLSIYMELLWTVGLFCLPATVNALYVHKYGEFRGGHELAHWSFAILALQELLILGLLHHLIQLNGEALRDFSRKIAWSDFGLGILMVIAALLAYWIAWLLLGKILTSPSGPQNVSIFRSQFSFLYLMLLLVNPIFEECLMRGFLQTRLRQAGLNSLGIVLASTVLQSAYHLYQGVAAALAISAIFFLFALYYQWTNRLWTVCVAHFFLDLGSVMQ